MMKLGTFHGAALMLAGSFAAAAALAQVVGGPGAISATGLDIPANARFLAADELTALGAPLIVNGTDITRPDADHRLAFIKLVSGVEIPLEVLPSLRQQVLRNMIDEVLRIQAAKAAGIQVQQREVDRYFASYASQFRQTPEQFAAFLRANGSSAVTIRLQIHSEIVWSRLRRGGDEPSAGAGEDEMRAVTDRLNAAGGTREYKVSEIFLAATAETAAEARTKAQRIVQRLRGGAIFAHYARQFSESSSASQEGNLGWIAAARLPAALATAVPTLPVGTVSDPIAIPGGFSIVMVADTRQSHVGDPRDSVLSLKQITMPSGGTLAFEQKVQILLRTARSKGGCGNAEVAAASIGAEIIARDEVRVRNLAPPLLQQILLDLGVGQATPPFGASGGRISILIVCGRDDPDQTDIQLDEIPARLRARRFLNDLRRDAVIDYR